MYTILLVEDDPAQGGLMQRLLERAGYRVRWVQDGVRAIVAAREPDIDLILLDVRIPGVDGIHVCRAVKEGPAPPPVIAMSAYDVQDELLRLGQQMPDSFLHKPFGAPALLEEIDWLIGKNRDDRTSQNLGRTAA